MMTIVPARAGKSFLAGVAAVGLILACTPMASADDPNDQCAQQEAPSSEQCVQQPSPGMPKLPDKSNSDNGNPQPPQQAPQQKPPQGDLADKNCWVVNGVPRWNAPGTAPAPTGPGDVVSWCPTTYGLQPH